MSRKQIHRALNNILLERRILLLQLLKYSLALQLAGPRHETALILLYARVLLIEFQRRLQTAALANIQDGGEAPILLEPAGSGYCHCRDLFQV